MKFLDKKTWRKRGGRRLFFDISNPQYDRATAMLDDQRRAALDTGAACAIVKDWDQEYLVFFPAGFLGEKWEVAACGD